MKKKCTVICVLAIILSLILIINNIVNRYLKNNNIIKYNNGSQYTIEKEDNIENRKELLKLFYRDGDTDYLDIPETIVESININYNIDFNMYQNIVEKQYNNDENLQDIVSLINDKLNITIDNNWKYSINKYNELEHSGMIKFLYYIDDIIDTNRCISFFFEQGVADKIYYSYLNKSFDQDIILYKYNYFVNHYKQERQVIDKLKDYYIVEGDRTQYSYNFENNKLIYSYTIFYQEPLLGSINPDWGVDMYIEPKIIEDFIKTYKIIVNDSNNGRTINTITNKNAIRELTKIMSRTLPMGNSEELVDVINSNWELELYDENDVLIDTLFVWNDGKLGFNNSRNEFLKDNYYSDLIKIIIAK